MGAFDADFADLVPKTTGRDFSADFEDLTPKPSGRNFDADFADLAPVARAAPEQTTVTLPETERPARMTLTRGGQSVLQPDKPEPLTKSAEWSAVLKSLPAQLVGSAESVGANLTEMVGKNAIEFFKGEIARLEKEGPGSADELEFNRRALAQAVARDPANAAAAGKAREVLASVTPQDQTTIQKGVSSFVQSAPSTLAAIVTGVLTRSPQAAMAVGGAGGFVQQAGATYGEAIAKGAAHEVARQSSAIQGAIELFDAIPVGIALKPGSAFMKRLGRTMVAEPLTEGAQQALQDLDAYLAYDPNMTLGQAWENVQIAMIAGTIGATVYTGAGHAMEVSRQNQALGQVAQDIEAVDVTPGTEMVAIDLLNPDRAQVREAIRAELEDGKRLFSMYGDAGMQAMAVERDAKAQEVAEAATAFADEAGVPDFEQTVAPDDLSGLRDFVPAGESDMTGQRLVIANMTAEAAAIDEAATERLAMQSEGMTDAEYVAALQEIINGNQQAVEDRGRGVGEADEPFALASETEADIRTREDAERTRREAEQREADERDARARADRERDDFGLTGSDRAADRQGGGSLFQAGWETAGGLTDQARMSWTDLVDRLAELAARITPQANVQAVRQVLERDNAAGRHVAARRLIEVALTSANPEHTFGHEAIHHLRDMGLFTPQEWKALESQARKSWRKQYDVESRWADQKLTDEGLSEEAVAEAFGSYRAGTLNAQPPVQKIMRKIAEFFRRLGNLLRGMGFQTVEDIFERVEAGEIGKREGAGEAATDGADKFAMRPIPRGLAPSVPPGVQQAYIASATRSLRRQKGQPATPFSDIGSFVDRFVKPRTIAAFFGESIPAYNTLIAEQQFRDEKFAEYARLAEPYFLASKEDRAVIGKVLEHDRLTGQIGLAGVNMTVGFTSPDARLSKPGERVTVTPEQKAAYWGVRRMLEKTFDDFKARLLEDFNLRPGMTVAQIRALAAVPQTTGLTPAQNRAYTRRVKELTAAANALEDVEQVYRAEYFPFSRFGNVGIAVKGANGTTIEYVTLDLGPINRRRAHNLKWDRIPEVKAELARLRAKYQGTTAVIGTPFEIPAGKLAKEVKLADVDVLAEIGKIDSAEWDAIRQQLIAGQAAQGYRAHLFRSKNTPGYSTDFERVLANYINQAATFQARRKFAKQWNAAINNIDAGRMGKLRQYWTDLAAHVHDGTEEHSALRATTFVYYLTSIASWMTNLTQTVTTVAPIATQYSNPLAVTAAMSRAWLESGRMLSAKATWQRQFYDPSKAPIDVRAAVQKAWDEGQFVNVVTRDYMGLARNSHPILKKLTPGAQKVVEIAGAGFTVAEMQNRIATYIAMYRLARDNPNVRTRFAAQMADNAIAADLIANWSPEGFAEFMNDEGNFKQGKINRARLERGVGTVVTQFWGYTWNFMERLFTLVALQGSEGRAAAALMLGIMAFLTGVWGLPGMDRLRQLIEFLNRKVFKNDLDMDREMRKLVVEVTNSFELAYMMSGGITRATGGPDLVARVGMGNLFNTPVFLDLVGRIPDAMEQFEVNNTKLAIAEMLPKQAGDILVAQAWGEQGVRTAPSATGKDKQIIPPDRVTAGMQAQKALGFTPAEVSERRALERAEKRIERSTDEVRRDWYSRMAKAEYARERAEAAGKATEESKWEKEIDDIWAEIDKWNNSHKDSEFVRLDPETRRENVRREREGAERQKGKRKAPRGEIQSIQDLYNTEIR